MNESQCVVMFNTASSVKKQSQNRKTGDLGYIHDDSKDEIHQSLNKEKR